MLKAESLASSSSINGWEGALLRMRAERIGAPLETFKQMVFDVLLQGKSH